MKIYTIGHSNRSIKDFVEIVKHYNIEILIDIRRFPRSLSNPQFNKENLEKELRKKGIEYIWIEELGGYRRFGRDVKDIGIGRCFKSEGFRAYATYILNNEKAKEKLNYIEELAKEKTICLMCAEKFYWNCHRKILSDYFLSKGFKVLHIIDKDKVIEHKYTSCAKIINNELFYE